MKILLLNAGSSSLKGTLVESEQGTVIAHCHVDWAGTTTRYSYTSSDGKPYSDKVSWRGHVPAVQRFVLDLTHVEPVALSSRSALAAAGHRVVHGGRFTSSVPINAQTRSRIAELAELAPLHNPPSLETLRAVEVEFPNASQVAVFDTAFHATISPAAYTYPIPAHWTRDWGIRRFGFHGLSHAYCSRRAAEILERPLAELRLVICHLGHGCSASAVGGGKCIDTTMGFTPLEGLMMATRSGSLDPGAVLHILQRHGLTPDEVETALNCQSGLLGASELSADMRQVLVAAKRGHERAKLALGIYVHRVQQAIGALAVTLRGIDALVFTAGVGEHAAEVRESICGGLSCLGLELDPQANAACRPDADVARRESSGRILVIATREDVTMLQEVIQVLESRR
jgi:acetate kinase